MIRSEIACGDSGGSGQALLAADGCVGMSPSDTAPALVALDGKMVIEGYASASRAPKINPCPALTAVVFNDF